MEVKILHHPAHESVARKIGELLTTNGISSQISDTTDAPNGVNIAVTKLAEQQDNTVNNASSLTSSFVEVDYMPGY